MVDVDIVVSSAPGAAHSCRYAFGELHSAVFRPKYLFYLNNYAFVGQCCMHVAALCLADPG